MAEHFRTIKSVKNDVFLILNYGDHSACRLTGFAKYMLYSETGNKNRGEKDLIIFIPKKSTYSKILF